VTKVVGVFVRFSCATSIAKTIFVTSTFSNEGKTFVSANLAATFALSGKSIVDRYGF
jgi:Mrp family chromosome partitioning ATPase